MGRSVTGLRGSQLALQHLEPVDRGEDPLTILRVDNHRWAQLGQLRIKVDELLVESLHAGFDGPQFLVAALERLHVELSVFGEVGTIGTLERGDLALELGDTLAETIGLVLQKACCVGSELLTALDVLGQVERRKLVRDLRCHHR